MTIVVVRFAGAVLALAVVTACAAACAESSPSGPGATSSSAAPTSAAAPAPAEFVQGPCPNPPRPVPELERARCGVLVVPEDRSRPDGRKLRLAVAIVPSETQPPAADPILFMSGGPGVDAILDPPIPADVGINRNRDLILLSLRGTHSSQPALTCPEIDEFFARRVGLVYDAQATGDQYVQAVTQCRGRLAPEADFAAFNTNETAQDLAALRKALKIEKWNVFSHSYSTEIAQVYMRIDPGGIRSVSLDGVVPVSVASPGWTWSSAKEAFDAMTRACAEQPACEARYPDLAQTFTRMVNELETNPVTTTVTRPGHPDVTVVLDGGALLNWFVPIATHFPAEFPAAIDELAHNNPKRIAEGWVAAFADPSKVGLMAWGMSLNVWCREWVPFESEQDQLDKAKEAFPDFPESVRAQAPQLPFLRQGCAAWNVPKAPEDIRQVTESDVPALVISGSFDGQTGAQWGRFVAQHLSNAKEVTVAGEAHGVYASPCGAKVIASFFDNPQQPDTSCVSTTQPPPFEIIPPLP